MKPLILFSFLFSISVSFATYGQDILVNSKDSIEIVTLIKQASQYKNRNIDSAKQDALKALELSKQKDIIYLQGLSNKALGAILTEKGGQKNLLKSITYFDRASELFKSLGDSSESFKHANNLSIVYKEMNDLPKALDFAMKAVNLSKKLDMDLELKHRYQAAAHLSLGNIYKKIHLIDSARTNFKKAEFHYKEIKSPLQYNAIGNIGLMLLEEEKYQESYVYLKNALEGFKKHDNLFALAHTFNNLGDLLLKMENTSEAKNYYYSALKISSSKNFSERRLFSYLGLSKVYYKEENNDSLRLFIEKTIDLSDSLQYPEIKSEILQLKAKYKEDLGQMKEALKLYKLSEQLNDSILKKKNLPETTKVLVEHQNQVNEAQIKGIEGVLVRKNVWIIFIIIILITLSIISYLMFKKIKTKLTFSNSQKDSLLASLKTERENNDYVNRKLVAATANLALKTDLLSRVNVLLENIKKQTDKNLNKEINDTQSQIKVQQNLDTMWNEFFIHFEEVHPDFLKQLKSKYEITQHDLKICAFLKMNLSNKEICQLLNINPTTVRVNIHRIKKKLNIPKETSVADFFSAN